MQARHKTRRGSTGWVLAGFAAAVLAGCSPQQAPEAAAQGPSLHEVMAGTIDPNADVLWKTSAKGLDEAGLPKAGLLSGQDWAAMAAAARELGKGAELLARPGPLRVVPPGGRIKDEGEKGAATAAQVQQCLDAKGDDFRHHAQALRAIAGQFDAAITARDVMRLTKASDGLDGVCEGCHVQFWYPGEKPLY